MTDSFKPFKLLAVLMLLLIVIPVTTGGTLGAGSSHSTEPSLLINEIAFNTTDPNAVWFEVYNPTAHPVNLKNWSYGFEYVKCIFFFPPVSLKSHGYAVITPSVENFTRYWNVNIPNVYRGTVLPHAGNLGIFRFNSSEKDIVDIDHRYLPLNWSWARYRDSPYTGNFTHDFYLEPHPTPGAPNHEEKITGFDLWKISGYLVIGTLLIAVMVLIPYLVAYRIRKKRGML